jgi:hypothetical protein
MKPAIAALALAACALGACQSGGPPPPDPGAAPAALETPETPETFGDEVKATEFLALAEILDAPDRFADQQVAVEGRVRRNCTVKGCWMELGESIEESARGARVTFKDYGFFVPLDSAGARARVEGVVVSKVVSQREVDHLEGEGATFPHKLPDGTAREVRIVATGVELFRKPAG